LEEAGNNSDDLVFGAPGTGPFFGFLNAKARRKEGTCAKAAKDARGSLLLQLPAASKVEMLSYLLRRSFSSLRDAQS
jgi:hypothetical protein